MVSRWTWIILLKWIFILARNYNGFVVDMDSLVQLHIRLRACIQRGVFIMLLEYSQNRLHSRTRMQNVRSHVVRETVRSESNRPRSSPPRSKSAPRGSKSTTFAKGIFQLFNLQKIGMNPIGDPSVLPIQFPIYLWLQAEVWEAFAIEGWCVVSSIPYFIPLCLNRKFKISKFTVQP